MDLKAFTIKAQSAKKANEQFLKKLKRKSSKQLDTVFHEQHEKTFATTDCLTCANCCKTTSPIFYQKDIERAAKSLSIKPGDFLKNYLHMDEDGDFVLNSAPCVFLEKDNRCRIYDARPTACREYPHTNRKNMHQVLDLTYRNTLVCPAVLEIVQGIQILLKKTV